MKSRVLALFLVLLYLITPITAFNPSVYAQGTMYVTTNTSSPVWSEPSSKSTKLKTLGKGVYVSIFSTTKNSAGNLWGKTPTGTWIYMGNLGKTSKNLSPTGLYITTKADVPLRQTPAAGATIERTLPINTCLTITDSFYTDTGNEWGKTSDGYVVYMGNIASHTHSYEGGICKICRYEYPYTVTPISGTYYTANADVPVWSRPYKKNSKREDTIEEAGRPVAVTAKTINQAGNLWYKTTGGWIFSENLIEPHTHSYEGGICKICRYEYPYTVIPTSGTYYTANADVPVWSRPYKKNSKREDTIEEAGRPVAVTAKTINQAGNLWYKTTGGWIFSENLTSTPPPPPPALPPTPSPHPGDSTEETVGDHQHKYIGGICSLCSYEYPLVKTEISETYYTAKKDVPIWNRPYSKNSEQKKIIANEGSPVEVIAQAVNAEGNLWFQIKDPDELWIFSGNLNLSGPSIPSFHQATLSTSKAVYSSRETVIFRWELAKNSIQEKANMPIRFSIRLRKNGSEVETIENLTGTSYHCKLKPGSYQATIFTYGMAKPSSNTVSFEVKEYIPVSVVSIEPATLILKVSGYGILKACIEPENASNKTVSWTSSDSKIASVDEHGSVVGRSTGSVVIKAHSADGSIAERYVVVNSPTFKDRSMYVFAENLSLRCRPGLNQGTVQELAYTQEVKVRSDVIVERDGYRWVCVDREGKVGWVEWEYLSDVLFYWPVPGCYEITSHFGVVRKSISPVPHRGIDIWAEKETKIVAARKGTVTIPVYNESYGWYVIINHDQGYSTLYAHMCEKPRAITNGENVEAGQEIGKVGMTGINCTGNHLHFEVKLKNVLTDPEKYPYKNHNKK